MNSVVLIDGNEGKLLHIANGQYRTIISGTQTGERYAVIEMNVPPGGGPGPHAHKTIEEIFYVVSGEVDFYSESGVSKAKSGDTVHVPMGGAIHAFKNNGDNTARLICTVLPAGLEQMFAEIDSAGLSLAKEIGEKFGNQFYPPDYLEKKL
ncbi:MAG: cupin domain-containing protein [Chitinophagaceae bacterium]|nr:MAG: cupin domain-containing protein [Chitinophagaceae bacterium]